MLADDDVQRMYDLARFLHPDPGVALAVTLEAWDRLALLQRLQDRQTGRSWLRLPEACLPQYCVYLASDVRERDQERPRPGQDPRERPTPDNYLVRYIKFLIWQTMDRNACHVAVALGCFLYGYQPGDIAQLAPAFLSQNIQRIRRRLVHQLQSRFPRANLFQDDHGTRHTRPPTAHDRRLVRHALARFTPWGSAHVPPPALDQSMRDSHFDQASARSEWDRIHALIDPAGGGLPRLIREYNRQLPRGSARGLEDPDAVLAIPSFHP